MPLSLLQAHAQHSHPCLELICLLSQRSGRLFKEKRPPNLASTSSSTTRSAFTRQQALPNCLPRKVAESRLLLHNSLLAVTSVSPWTSSYGTVVPSPERYV